MCSMRFSKSVAVEVLVGKQYNLEYFKVSCEFLGNVNGLQMQEI